MLVSVVVPSYNHAAFVAAALRSVYHQTFADIEVVIVDDASPDQSISIIRQILGSEQWQTRFAGRSHVISFMENEGAHVAINTAIRESTGDYVAILNSDDVFRPDRLECMVKAASGGAEFMFSRCWFLDASAMPIPVLDDRVRRFWETQNQILEFPTVGFAFMGSNVALSTGNFMFSRRLFDRVGGFAELRYCHDWHFALSAILRVEPVFIDLPLYGYRVHGGNSFLSLNEIAEAETLQCQEAFIGAARLADNPLAPTERNWPGIFDVFADWTGLKK